MHQPYDRDSSLARALRLLFLAPLLLTIAEPNQAFAQAAAPVQAASGQPAAGAAPTWQQYALYNLPGYYALGQDLVRKEMQLVPEQEEALKKLAKESQQQIQELYVPLRNTQLSNEERTKIFQELQPKMKEMQVDVERQVKKILLPHQVKALEMAQLRTQIANMLQYGPALDRVGLSDDQKKQIQKNRAELAEKLYDLQKEAFEDVTKILTPEQIDKLKQPWNAGQAAGEPK
jgi:3-isopropylmalate dehydratase small subunit